MEADRRPDPEVDYPRHRLPEDLYQSDDSKLSVPLGEEDDILPGTFHWKPLVSEGGLNEVDHLFPVGRVWGLLPGHRRQPPAEVLGPHPRGPP